jgi:hypothetical protein
MANDSSPLTCTVSSTAASEPPGPRKPSSVSEDVHQFIKGTVWEVDGFRSEFRDLVELLENGSTQARMVEFIDSLG